MSLTKGSRLAALLAVAAVGVGACGSDDGDDETPAPDADATQDEPPVDCDPAREIDTTDEENRVFDFDGDERSYLLALPDDYDGTTAQPMVFNFHGFGNDMEGHDAYTAMGEAGTDRGYVVVTPNASGEPRDWNYFSDEDRADDFGFIDALVADLSEQLCVDQDRIYATGHSAGSAFSGFLVCKEPHRFAAVAMVAAFIPTTCPTDEVAPSAIAFHGTDDPVVPYDGGELSGEGAIPDVFDTLDQYAEAYQCDQPAGEDEAADDVQTHTLTGCVHGSEVVLYTLVGGGHGWPGNTAGVDISGQPGNALEQFPATDTILDFFDRDAQ